MTLDIQAFRNKLNELKKSGAASEIIWKPSPGSNQIRIVPLKGSPDNPFIELYFHYLGGKTFLSPLSFDEPDPIAEFGEKLLSAGGLSKEEWVEIKKKFTPSRRTFVPVIDRKKPENGVRFWAFGKTVYTDLLAVMADPEYGDITDLQSGRDIKVEFTPQEKSDTNFAKTSIRVSPKQTALSSDAEEMNKFLSEQPDLFSLYKKMSYQELEEVLDKFVNGSTAPSRKPAPAVTNSSSTSSDEEWGLDATVESAPAATPVSSKKVNKTDVKDVGDAFDDMFSSK